MTDDLLTFPEWCDGPERAVPRSECVKVSIPTLFYQDHVWRALTAGVPVTEGRYITVVWLDTVALWDLIGDADYYAGFEGEDYAQNRSICGSARRTLAALRKQTPETFTNHQSVWEGV